MQSSERATSIVPGDEGALARVVVAIGASAGGLEPLVRIVSALPSELDAALLVVVHVSRYGPSFLPMILARAGRLPAQHATDREPLCAGRIYVAPPDAHLTVADGVVRVTRGPRENGHRPAVDPLFRSVARAFGSRAIGVILSGTLDDGSAGLAYIKGSGGVALVQSPDEAQYRGMPQSAAASVSVDAIMTADELGVEIVRRVREVEPVVSEADMGASRGENGEERAASGSSSNGDPPEGGAHGGDKTNGTPSVYTCPDCHGTLWELSDGHLLRFECRVGHAYGAESLFAGQGEFLERALYEAYRALTEAGALARRLAERARERGQRLTAEQFDQEAEDARARAACVKLALAGRDATVSPRLPHELATRPDE